MKGLLTKLNTFLIDVDLSQFQGDGNGMFDNLEQQAAGAITETISMTTLLAGGLLVLVLIFGGFMLWFGGQQTKQNAKGSAVWIVLGAILIFGSFGVAAALISVSGSLF